MRRFTTTAILGAEQYNFGTIAMIAMVCVYVRKCHLNNCPVGVATTDPKWRGKFKGRPEHVINFMKGVAEEVREIMASLGIEKLDDLIGRPEFLKQKTVPDNPKANSLDLSPILKDATQAVADTHGLKAEDITLLCQQERNDGLHQPALDIHQILKEIAKVTDAPEDTPAINVMDRPSIELEYEVVNTNRNIGTRLSGATAVVEGTGDHGCEYMTNGLVTVLCHTGTNFGAGMSGGTACVYDIDGKFQSRINPEMVIPLQVRRNEHIAEVKAQIEKQVELTGSERGKEILADWKRNVKQTVRVIPKDKHALKLAEDAREDAGALEIAKK